MKKLLLLISILIVVFKTGVSQIDYSFGCYYEDSCLQQGDSNSSQVLYDSRYGSKLSPHGTIRLLVIFIELEYDDISFDPSPLGDSIWPASTLPLWANQLFSPFIPNTISDKTITNYYQRASSNDHIVLGDYLLAPDNGGVFKMRTTTGNVRDSVSRMIETVNWKMGTNINTFNGLSSITDFDQWTPSFSGLPKINYGNNNWDFVVFIVRNSNTPKNLSGLNISTTSQLLGYNIDAGCLVNAGGGIPTHVIRHEYAHTLLGANNYHTCGGGNNTSNYWIPLTGGWALLGLYGSSLMCWNAWDRYRLGWKAPDNDYEISTRSSDGQTEVNGDIGPETGNGIYVLRDFVTTGDAIRIKLPFIDPQKEYPEWIWLENHQGVDNNGVVFDQWQYQERSCVTNFIPGIMSYLQINSETRTSYDHDSIFKQYSDYLYPLTANGFWDRYHSLDSVNTECVSFEMKRPFVKLFENPLTGGGDQCFYSSDLDNNHSIGVDDQLPNWTELSGSIYLKNLFQLGHSLHSFHLEVIPN